MTLPDMPTLLIIGAAVLLIAASIWSVTSRATASGRFRRSDIAVIAAALLVIGSLAATRELGVEESTAPGTEASLAAAAAAPRTATCASIRIGMRADEVRALLGSPDSTRSAADLRGPGAELWTFGSSRCTIHVVGGVVEFIE